MGWMEWFSQARKCRSRRGGGLFALVCRWIGGWVDGEGERERERGREGEVRLKEMDLSISGMKKDLTFFVIYMYPRRNTTDCGRDAGIINKCEIKRVTQK